MLLIGVSIEGVSAIHIEQNDDAAGVNSSTVRTEAPEVIPVAKPSITLSAVNQLRIDPKVTVLFALPKLSEGARPLVPSYKGAAGCQKHSFPINGELYGLWANYSSWDLERDGGAINYTNDQTSGDRTSETWISQYYLVKQGAAPGESENALDMTGKIPGLKGIVYVFFGDVFLTQEDARCSDNDGYRTNKVEVERARQCALNTRTRSEK